MSYRAHVIYRDLPRDALAVAIGRRLSNSDGSAWQAVIAVNGQGITLETIAAGTEAPHILIPHQIAIALLDALSQHFGGTSDVRQLRADYDAERLRVDRLQNTLSAIARGNTESAKATP